MHENRQKDPSPSDRTLKGSELKVLNLRPLQKEKHLGSASFRTRHNTQGERIQQTLQLRTQNHFPLDSLNLPNLDPTSGKIERILRKKRAAGDLVLSGNSSVRSGDSAKLQNKKLAMQKIAIKEKQMQMAEMRKINAFSPSSPIKEQSQLDEKSKFVPFLNQHNKTYFKTIENMMQNANNQTRKMLIHEIDHED